jgi:hypothetical protein
MCYPSDDDLCDQFIAETLRKAELEGSLSDPLDPAMYRALDPFKYMKTDKKDQCGITAGAVLVILRTMVERHPDHEPSLNTAYEILEADLRGSGRSWERGRPPANRSDIRSAWAEFKSVSHLWAALFLAGAELRDEKALEKMDDEKALLQLLAVAEDMRIFAENFQQRRSKTALSPPGSFWEVPKEIPLPRIKINLSPLPEWAQKIRRID